MTRNLLLNSVIADIETLSLSRGSGIYEASFFHLDTGFLSEYLFQPNIVGAQAWDPLQDITKLASSQHDQHVRIPVGSWPEAIAKQIELEHGVKLNPNTIRNNMGAYAPFLERQVNKRAGWLFSNQPDPGRLASLHRAGVNNIRTQSVDMTEFLKKDLLKEIEGKTVWIANTMFESKQFGAQLSADGITDLKKTLETFNESADPFHITGKEVNEARVRALLSDDWTQVWRAYNQFTPKAGETAVRDILDVSRAMASYSYQLGISKNKKPMYVGVDVQSTILSKILGVNIGREMHSSAEDAAIHEAFILREQARITADLQSVAERTGNYKDIVAQAKQGRGSLYQAAQMAEILDTISPDLARHNLMGRLARAEEQLIKEGSFFQQTGISRIISDPQMTPSGQSVDIDIPLYDRRAYQNLEQIAQAAKSDRQYMGIDPMEVLEDYKSRVSGNREQRLLSIAQLTNQLDEISDRALNNIQVPTISPKAFTLSRELPNIRLPGAKAAGGVMLAGALLGFTMGRKPEKNITSNLTYNYEDYLQKIDGMPEQGLAKERRSQFTDFGSPYQGPVASNEVFFNQEMLRERQKYIRQEFGARHYNPESGVMRFFALKHYELLFRGGYKYIGEGDFIYDTDGIQGEARKVNLENFNVKVEDADTVTLTRKSMFSGVKDFFGLNQKYSFRLAGIDAPETAHGDAPAQPGGNEGRAALQAALASAKSLSLIYKTDDVSYGRMMAVLQADGQDLNKAMVRQGVAAHLPYGKAENAMVDYSAYKRLENRARGGNVGMWSSPWAQAYGDISDSMGQRVTFNQLAKLGDVVQHSGKMSMITHMDSVQSNGYGALERMTSQEIGQLYNPNESLRAVRYDKVAHPHKSYLQEQMADLSSFIKTKGDMRSQNRFSARGNYSDKDLSLSVDSMGSSTSIWNKGPNRVGDLYVNRTSYYNAERRSRQAKAQRDVNQSMFQSGINHHRM